MGRLLSRKRRSGYRRRLDETGGLIGAILLSKVHEICIYDRVSSLNSAGRADKGRYDVFSMEHGRLRGIPTITQCPLAFVCRAELVSKQGNANGAGAKGVVLRLKRPLVFVYRA